MVLQVLQPWQCPVSRLWPCSPSCQLWELQGASSTAEKQGLVLLAALYPRSVPASQAKQGLHAVSLYYIRLHYISSTKWTGKQFNVKAQSQEKLKLPGSLKLQTVAATYIAYYFAEAQDLGFRNISHLLVASRHTYIPITF